MVGGRTKDRPVSASDPGVRSDPTALTLLRSGQLQRRQRAERLMAEVAALRRRNAALRARADQLRAELDATPARREQPPGLAALAAQAVSRHLGVWAAAASPGRLVVRFRPDALPAHTLQLREDVRGALTAVVKDLPTGVDVDKHLETHGTRKELPALVCAVGAEVAGFCRRRAQVAALRALMSPRRLDVWHDPAHCDVRVRVQLTGQTGRVWLQLQMMYRPPDALPHECVLQKADRLDDEERSEIAETSRVFLRLPLDQAMREAFF